MFAKYVSENYRYVKTPRFFTFQLYVCLGSGSCFSLSQTRVRTTSWFGLKYLFLVETSCDKYPCFGCNKMGNCPEFLLKNIRWRRADKRRKAVGPRQKISCNFTRKKLGRVWDTTCQHYVPVTWTIVSGNLMQTFENVSLLHNIGYYFRPLNYTLGSCHARLLREKCSDWAWPKSLEEDKFNLSVVSVLLPQKKSGM